MRREGLIGLVLLLPALIIIAVFRLLPILYSFRMSLFDWGLAGPTKFVLFANYLELSRDPNFLTALINTFYYVLGVVPFTMIFALFVALILNQGFRFRGLFRVLYYLPVVTSIVAISVVWRWIFNPDRGLFNAIFNLLGLGASQFLNESRGIFSLIFGVPSPVASSFLTGPSVALLCIIFMSVWKELGYCIIIYLAALQSIPGQYYESAKIDGAGSVATFFKITLPLLSPTSFYILIMMTITSFNVFGPIYVMTGPPAGGPLGTTNVVVHFLYEESFKLWKLGYGSAIAFIVFLIIFIITRVQKILVERRVHYE